MEDKTSYIKCLTETMSHAGPFGHTHNKYNLLLKPIIYVF